MNSYNLPCKKDGKQCEKRYVGCHSKCKEYSEWEQARHEELEKRKQRDLMDRQFRDSAIQRANKARKRRG